VSASEDRVVGSLDLEHAITEGQRRFEPGLLAQVNRGVLYVDEVNLLDDHLVDVLLDAAAMGVNTVEREGISVSHPARFMLVGTMNPEEGELRPQLLDRFGLAVEIGGLTSVEQRVAVIERRMAYEENPDSFTARWQEPEREIAERILAAQRVLPQVIIQPTDMAIVASLVLELGVDGHRADLTILEAARTHAAWSGRTLLTTEDIRIAAELALPHRLRRQPFLETQVNEQTIGETVERCSDAVRDAETQQQQSNEGEKKNSSDDTVTGEQREQDAASGGGNSSASSSGQPAPNADQQHNNNKTHQSEDPFHMRRMESKADRLQRRAGGRRSRTRTNRKQGRYVSSKRVQHVTDLAFDATLREAAPYQLQRRLAAAANSNSQHPQHRLLVHTDDLRQKVRVRRTRNAVCFVVDASWSMAAEERMRTTKAAVLSLLRDAYQRRDLVGLVSFQRTYASVLLPLTNSVELAQKCLQTMPTGGKTPLARGILTGFEQLERARRQDPEVIPLLVLITDGQANVAIGTMKPQIEAYHIAAAVGGQDMHAIVIDTEHPHFDRGLSRQLAFHLQGDYYHLDDLSGGKLVRMVLNQMGN
jgi:magnesium chelatase subunit D